MSGNGIGIKVTVERGRRKVSVELMIGAMVVSGVLLWLGKLLGFLGFGF